MFVATRNALMQNAAISLRVRNELLREGLPGWARRVGSDDWSRRSRGDADRSLASPSGSLPPTCLSATGPPN